jgi:hypothetical protein
MEDWSAVTEAGNPIYSRHFIPCDRRACSSRDLPPRLKFSRLLPRSPTPASNTTLDPTASFVSQVPTIANQSQLIGRQDSIERQQWRSSGC